MHVAVAFVFRVIAARSSRPNVCTKAAGAVSPDLGLAQDVQARQALTEIHKVTRRRGWTSAGHDANAT